MDKENDKCPRCHGRGIIIIDENSATPCNCNNNRMIRKKFKNANMSSEILSCKFRDFSSRFYSKNCKNPINGKTFYDNAKAAFNAAQKFVKDMRESREADGLILTGSVGSGKTFLAGAIANSLLEDGRELLFVVVPDFLDEIRATYDQGREFTEHDLMNTARQVGILIFDDLGAHNYTDWTRNRLYSIINHRLNNRLPTIITTNLEIDELEDYVGQRITSRIIQMCKVYCLAVETDIRIMKRNEKSRKG